MNGVLEGFVVSGVVSGVVIVVGYLLGRSGVLGPSAVEVLSRLAFFVASPALLFVTLAHADVGLATTLVSVPVLFTVVALLD